MHSAASRWEVNLLTRHLRGSLSSTCPYPGFALPPPLGRGSFLQNSVGFFFSISYSGLALYSWAFAGSCSLRSLLLHVLVDEVLPLEADVLC